MQVPKFYLLAQLDYRERLHFLSWSNLGKNGRISEVKSRTNYVEDRTLQIIYKRHDC
ncbi:hypothetical protein TorRG33x02_240930 [Trema orientale]|uniref:Uncharacterized protein n=1 Tax=Trema orientale TaxID=63057 RepID=A0A2P5DV12_TREOI|nr:hypothetical protein TorRG33x02_240930 [Trema orientale]